MYDVLIIGAGPAGASAGIFMARAKKKVLILDNDKSGTKKAWAANHYAVMGITGYDVFETGKRQAEKYGAEVKLAEVSAVERSESGFRVTACAEVYESAAVILATGAAKGLARQMGLQMKPGKEEGGPEVIAVDEEGRTSMKGVWAAGICTGQSMHISITSGDGARVAINLLSEWNGRQYVDHDMMC
ncbi:FAD-binding protein [Xylanibacillus composti]|uniref:FAD/NAD(P)-binding domain-containing protein n=1 Tax=Xylanibacillus composti TaxID=1572762 RepID=A0A8J4M2P5_9BACL|nr:FAD-dependent oxidoreductase [Xylanibacillus composti]MDT9726748.1 FAD-binding protein [Xylanibacillus composti]GIQ69320.1 hypothetical protein XYCOK13_21440 [Xylanibacillus composti]